MNHSQSSGLRFSARKESAISSNILSNEDTVRAISAMRQVFQSCLGPRGRCKILHNAMGGHVTVTSCAGRLLRASQVTNPVLRLITTAVQGHLDRFSDGGTLMATLATLIIERLLKLEINRRLITDVLDVSTVECIRYLNSNECPARVTVSLDSLCDLLGVVNGVTSAKPATGMTSSEVCHINQCLVEAFLKTTPDASATKTTDRMVQYLCFTGRRPVHSYLANGLFIHSPQTPTSRVTSLAPRRIPEGIRKGLVAVAVYGTSLAGDAEDKLGVEFEVASDVCLNEVVLEEMMDAARHLVNNGAGVVTCQKVVHPEVKRYLVNHGVMVFDRLGLAQVKLMSGMVGGRVLGSFRSLGTPSDFGYIENITHEIISGRSYLRIEGAEKNILTLVLFSLTEESLEELKYVSATANHVLWQTIESKTMLKSKGEWQRLLAYHLKGLTSQVAQFAEALMCSKSEACTVLETLSDCFMEIFYTVSGQSLDDVLLEDTRRSTSDMPSLPVVFDSLPSALNAVKSALFLAHLVLEIRHFVADVN